MLQVREPGLSLSSRPCIRTFLCPVLNVITSSSSLLLQFHVSCMFFFHVDPRFLVTRCVFVVWRVE